MPHYTVHLLNAFLLTLVLIHALNMIATRLGLLDLPQGRKMHEHPVPATGGLAMFGAFIVPVMLLEPPPHLYWGFLIGISTLVLIGAIDDRLVLGPWIKLGGQIAAVVVMILPGRHLIGSAALLGALAARLPQIELIFTICFVVGVVNAFNMLDGLDGLAGGAAAAALVCLSVVAWLSGMTGTLIHLLLLVCAVLGFLVFNLRHRWRRQATVYMGDAGSMMLGAAIAFFTVVLSVGPEKAAPFPVLLWFFALPVFDTLILIMRRLATGNNPLCGDRRHLHHFLLRAGISPQTATAILVAACLVLGTIGLIGWRLGAPDHLMLLGLMLPFTLHIYVVFYGWKVIGQLHDIPDAQVDASIDALQVAGD